MLSSLCKETLGKQLEQKAKDETNSCLEDASQDLLNKSFFEISCDDILTFENLKTSIENSDAMMLRRIVSAGREVEYLTAEGSLLYAAVKFGAPLWFLEELLEFEADPNYFSYQDHQTALHFAAREGKFDVLEILLDYGGNPMELDIACRSVIDVARRAGHEDCIEKLQQIMNLRRDLKTKELGEDRLCEKNRLSTICERTEKSTMLNGSHISGSLLVPQHFPMAYLNSDVSDEELYDQLKHLGMDPAPVNEATRPIYLHQLGHLRLGNDVRLTIGDETSFMTAIDGNCASHLEGDCCQVVHKDTDSGLMLREEHYGTKRSLLPANVVQASPSQAIPPELVKLSNDEIREKLIENGELPGPVNRQTRAVYLRQLHRLQQQSLHTPSPSQLRSVLSPELYQLCIRFEHVFDAYSSLERQMEESFQKPGQRWREGSAKTAFTYLLLDSSISMNLPLRAAAMSLPELMEVFVKSIFYVGKGKRSRPFAHLYQALEIRNQKGSDAKATPVKIGQTAKNGDKVKRICRIWEQGHGVVSLHVFQNVIPAEAYTREGAMIEALGINRLLTNEKRGEFYGVAGTWTARQRKQLGAYLVYRAMQVYLVEGERRLGPLDL